MTRLVVTGHDTQGASIVVSDQVLDGSRPVEGLAVVPLWSIDGPLTLPSGMDQAAFELLPPAGGSTATIFSVAPGANAAYHQFVAEHLGPHADPERSGMHVTPTLDYVVVLDGQVLMELDKGSVDLARGDVVVQKATMHRWTNTGDNTAMLLVVMLAAARP